MKKHLLRFVATLLFGCFCFSAFAQQQQQLPIDPKVRYGKLPNGLTYYIRHNEKPKGQAEFFIAQNVGSVLEEDSQSGLAHFLEHMAFNGSKHFGNKQMITYLQTIGVKFGENLNAYTSYDETVYNISNVPVSRQGIIDTCMLILHDWSGFLKLADKEIDEERKVIHEEWRTRRNAGARIGEKEYAVTLAGSPYAKRYVIGNIDVIDNFKYQELRDYYHKWYRPDLQAIIVVGDIDVDAIEQQLKTMFADIPKPVNAAERVYFKIPNNKEPIFSLSTDKEETTTTVKFFFKHDPIPQQARNTTLGIAQDFVKNIYAIMMSSRLQEIIQQQNAPFLRASTYDGMYMMAKTEDALVFYATCKEGTTKQAFQALLTEAQRVKQHGFTASEFERAETALLKHYESAYNERDKVNSGSYAKEYANNFVLGDPIPGVEVEYAIVQQIAKMLTVEQVNQYVQALIKQENVVIAVSGPEKEGLVYPSKDEMINMFNNSFSQKVEGYKDNVSTEPLISKTPKAGTISKQSVNEKYGTTEWVLSNGAKVVFKPTTFKDNEIRLQIVRPGGYSQTQTIDIANFKLINDVVSLGGLANFSATDLRKMLSGKQAKVSLGVNATEEGGSGSSTIADFETMMQLLYLNFTAPRMDSSAYLAYIAKTKVALEAQESNPMIDLTDSTNSALYKNNPLFKRFVTSDLAKVNYPKLMEIYKSRFSNAAGFTFVFVGNIDMEKMKPLILQYIGGLLGTTYKEPAITMDLKIRRENYSSIFEKPVETPKATILDAYITEMPYTAENRIKINMLSQILDLVFTEEVRMKEGGTYGVSVSSNIARYPKGETSIRIMFETSPERRDYLNGVIHRELKKYTETGTTEANFNKVKEFTLKKSAENMQDNGYWTRALIDVYAYKSDLFENYDAMVSKQTPDSIRLFAKSILDKSNLIEVLFTGTPKK